MFVGFHPISRVKLLFGAAFLFVFICYNESLKHGCQQFADIFYFI
ncbi:hypothetical protein [Lactococcus lactis]|nr:hypothetical protein [Lactococcus lactis]MDT2937599.1 hypothetical protein [Lactococcus lactis]